MKIEVVLSKTNIMLYLLDVSMKFTVNFLVLSFLFMGNESLPEHQNSDYNFLLIQSKSILETFILYPGLPSQSSFV